MTEEVQWLTVKEAASHFQLSSRTVYNLLKAGTLKSVKVGKSRRIPMQEILAFEKRLLEENA